MSDTIIKDISSAFKDPSVKDKAYRFTYVNSLGDRLLFYSDGIEHVEKSGKTFYRYSDMLDVSISKNIKNERTAKLVILNTGDSKIALTIDTKRDKFLDIFPVYRLLSRLIRTARKLR